VAGFFCGFLIAWPIIFAVAIVLVLFATKKSIAQERANVWSRFIVGWPQYIALFVSGFVTTLLILSGHAGPYIAFVPVFVATPIYCYNRKRFLKSFYFNVARGYLRETNVGR
jgi:hypothetical protein